MGLGKVRVARLPEIRTDERSFMKKLAMIFAGLIVCSGSAFAQSSQTTPEHHEKTGKQIVMVGCIYEKDGKYLLMSYKQSGGVELMSSEDLKAHVGHKVKVHGTMLNASHHSPVSKEEANADDRAKQEKHVVSHEPENGPLQVGRMDMISEKCDKTYRKSAEKQLEKQP
jgi:hypothetical protein